MRTGSYPPDSNEYKKVLFNPSWVSSRIIPHIKVTGCLLSVLCVSLYLRISLTVGPICFSLTMKFVVDPGEGVFRITTRNKCYSFKNYKVEGRLAPFPKVPLETASLNKYKFLDPINGDPASPRYGSSVPSKRNKVIPNNFGYCRRYVQFNLINSNRKFVCLFFRTFMFSTEQKKSGNLKKTLYFILV